MLRRWWPLLAVACLLAAASMAASTTSLPISGLAPVDEGAGRANATAPPIPTPEPSASAASQPMNVPEAPSWVAALPVALLTVFLIVVVALLVARAARRGPRFQRRSLRQRPVKVRTEDVTEEVAAALDAGLLELDDDDSDPRAAVIACWVRLERAAAAAGIPRQPGDTSTDLVLRLLSGHRLSPATLSDFAALYRRARYATHEVDVHMRDTARDALQELRVQLEQTTVGASHE